MSRGCCSTPSTPTSRGTAYLPAAVPPSVHPGPIQLPSVLISDAVLDNQEGIAQTLSQIASALATICESLSHLPTISKTLKQMNGNQKK